MYNGADVIRLDGTAGEMSSKSVTELVSNFARPFEGAGHVWLATRGPGEFVGGPVCFP